MALGGGGARAAAHIGVLRELARRGLRPAAVSGASAGALVGALYCAGADWHQVEAVARALSPKALLPRWRLVPRRTMPLLDFVHGWLGGATFESLVTPLLITALDLRAGEQLTYGAGPLLPALRAALALPGFLSPVRPGDGSWVIDAAVVNRVPVDLLTGRVDRIVAIDVKGNRPFPGGQRWRVRADVYGRIHDLAVEQVTAAALTRADLVIRPEVGHVSVLEVARAGECIDAGARAVEKHEPVLAQLWG